MDSAPCLILASASPRRAALLEEAGQRFLTLPSQLEETRRPGEPPAELAARLAREKALEVAGRARGRWVLGADTIVVIDDEPLGKPRDDRDAARMLRLLSGRGHRVLTAFALVDPASRVIVERTVESEVVFRDIGLEEIDAYVVGGEPLDKAGAYAIQGGASAFVSQLRGSRTNVVGLPMDEVEIALRSAGIWRIRAGEPGG
jgi:septum formation protein